jgi:uncharacterized membrane protein
MEDIVVKIGIFVTFLGALLMAIEHLRKYKGHKYNDQRNPMEYGVDPSVDGGHRTETDEYILWKSLNKIIVVVGVFILAGGIFLQII